MSELVCVCVHWSANNAVILQYRHDQWRHTYEEYRHWSKIDAVVRVIEILANMVPDFTVRLIEVDKQRYSGSSNRIRRYIAGERQDLYSKDRPDLAQNFSRRVADVWLADNLNKHAMMAVIDEACEAAGVKRRTIHELDWVKAAQPRHKAWSSVPASLATISPPPAYR